MITSWAVPVLLVLAVWLVAMRSSKRAAARFGNVARELSRESALLEQRLVTVNRELSLAREFVAAQSRDLDALGRMATERLSQHAGELERLILQNSEQVQSIATVSTSALDNMSKVRGELPVIANSARDMTSQIGNAGRTAQAHLDDLIDGFHRLNEFGEASERQVAALRTKVEAALEALQGQADRLEEAAGARYDLLDERANEFRARLEELEEKALAALKARADALMEEFGVAWGEFDAKESLALKSFRERLSSLRQDSEAFEAALRERQKGAVAAWLNSIDALRERLTATLADIETMEAEALQRAQAGLRDFRDEAEKLDAEMAQRSERSVLDTSERLTQVNALMSRHHQQYIAKFEEFVQRGENLAATLAGFGSQIDALSSQGSQASGEFADRVEKLYSRLETSRETIQSTSSELQELSEAAIRLLELIRAGEEHSQTKLSEAIAAAEERLIAVEAHTSAIGQQLSDAGEQGKLLSSRILAAERDSNRAIEDLDRLQLRLSDLSSDSRERIDSLRIGLSDLARECDSLSGKVEGDLAEAIKRIHSSMKGALNDLGSDRSDAISQLAENIGAQGAEAIERVIRERALEAIGDLEKAASRASGISRDAARQLRDQLHVVAELAGNLEARVARARERAQEQVDNDFAHRVALITESLNSNAIDISKALSSDVSDTAWASYLRGDRGIFTRKAVRLLENSEARDIAELYDRDPSFKEHVSRYIHDFEAILRTMLSTRDGKALGVTLLSSDMGKLYVALAQAIERLRA